MDRHKRINNLLKIFCIVIFGFYLLSMRQNLKYQDINNQLHDTLKEQNVLIEDQNKTIEDLLYVISEQDMQLQQVSETNKSYVDELTELRSRSELYDKYSYAIINESNQRTLLTYEEIKLGEQLMLEKGYDPNLMFGTIMVESGGDPNAVNSESGATGYGQFLDSTAEFVWLDLLDNEWYSSEIMKDGESNIKMMAEYYEYLYNTKGNTFQVIKQYSGNITDEGAAQYLAKINNYTQQVGVIIQ